MLHVFEEINPVIRRITKDVNIPVCLNKSGRASIVPPIIELRRAKIVSRDEVVGADASSSFYLRISGDDY